MHPKESSFSSPLDGTQIATYFWDDVREPRGVVQIAHGVAEHALRYGRLAETLNAHGYLVHANDHRGHGKSLTADGVLGSFGTPGFGGVAEDIATFGARIKDGHPDLPVFLTAHSMGSFASQSVAIDHSEQYVGIVLSGTSSLDVLAGALAGNGGPVGLESFNANFEDRTGYEWLSRDAAEVDKYVADPLCGFPLPDETLPQMFAGAARLADADVLGGIRDDLAVLLTSGQADPIAGDGQLVTLLADRYRDAGLRDVSVRIYPEARHEIFNETNRNEITADVIIWLDKHL